MALAAIKQDDRRRDALAFRVWDDLRFSVGIDVGDGREGGAEVNSDCFAIAHVLFGGSLDSLSGLRSHSMQFPCLEFQSRAIIFFRSPEPAARHGITGSASRPLLPPQNLIVPGKAALYSLHDAPVFLRELGRFEADHAMQACDRPSRSPRFRSPRGDAGFRSGSAAMLVRLLRERAFSGRLSSSFAAVLELSGKRAQIVEQNEQIPNERLLE